MTTDVIDLDKTPDSPDLARLARHRPTSDDIDAAWGAARRDRVLGGIRAAAVATDAAQRPAQAPPTSRRLGGRRRVATVIGVAAAAALAVTMMPALLAPGSLPAAGAIDRLAAAASRGQALVIPDGKYLHLVVHDTQRGAGESANGSRTLESWTSAGGQVWRKDTENGRVSYHSFPTLTGGPIDLSPTGVSTLPTDADALLDHLEANVEGSTSVHEAVFVAVGDMTRMGYTPPAVRAAAIQALGQLPEVSAFEAHGQVTLTFVDNGARPGVSNALVFDATTTRLVAETLTAPDLTYTSETLTSEVVGHLPEAVRTGAANTPVKEATGSAGPTG